MLKCAVLSDNFEKLIPYDLKKESGNALCFF